jgi:uncharacterized protein
MSVATEVPADLDHVRVIRGLVVHERTTYHCYSYRGDDLVYDIATGSVLAPDRATFVLLRGLEQAWDDERILAEVAAVTGAASLAEIAREVGLLHRLGMFQLTPLDSPQTRDRDVQNLLGHHARKMMLLVQTSCNLHCTYCYEVSSDFHFSQKGKMNLETAKKCVDALVVRSANRPRVEITFFGGEPLANFPLVEQVVAYCGELAESTGKEFSYLMTTNATLLDAHKIEFLVANRFAMMVSLDGPPETSDQVRKDLGGKGVAEKATANAQALVAAQVEAGLRPALIRATMSHLNHDKEAIEEYFSEHGFDRTMLGTSTGRAHAKTEADLTAEDIGELANQQDVRIDRYVTWLEGKGPAPHRSELERGLNWVAGKLESGEGARIGCGVGRNVLAQTADGTYYPCHRYAGEEAYELGNLETGLDRGRLERFYRELLDGYDGHCSKCWARVLCGGQCAHYVSRPDGTIGEPDEQSCNDIRTGMEKLLWLRGLTDRLTGEKEEGAVS